MPLALVRALSLALSTGIGSGAGALSSALWTGGISPALLGYETLRPHSNSSFKYLLYWLNPELQIFQNKKQLIVALAFDNLGTTLQVVVCCKVSYTGGLVLCVGSLQARDDYITQTNI